MTTTLVPLETVRRKMSFVPWHFWQLANKKIPVNSACNSVIRKRAWDFADATGRDDVVEALAAAEARLKEYLGYSVAPHYVTEEIDFGPCIYHSANTLLTGGTYASGYYGGVGPMSAITVALGEGYLRAIGTPTLTLLGTANVTYLDNDGDQLKETFVVTIANSTITDLASIEVYFSQADQLPWETVDMAEYQVRPVIVTRPDPNTIKVVGPSWLVVRPVLYQAAIVPGYDQATNGRATNAALDPDNAANFVTTLDIYQRTLANPQTATLTFDNAGTLATYSLAATVQDTATGVVLLNTQGAGPIPCGCNSVAPGVTFAAPQAKRLTIGYQAGANIADWDLIVSRLAMAELLRPVGGCEEANREVYRWQVDLARANGIETEQFKVDPQMVLQCPLGTRAGEVYAWMRIKSLRNQRGIAI